MKVPDIYFEKFWGLLNAEHDGGTFDSYTYEDENGVVLYRFIKRSTNIIPNTYDIVTPYGFNGPIIIDFRKNRKKELVCNFNENFQEYCFVNNIIAEYIRFSPWIRNHEDFKDIYELSYNNYTLGVDLTSKDFFFDEFSSKCRNQIRKAEKMNVQIQFDFNCETVEEFYRLYNIMADKNDIDVAYRFSRKYIVDLTKICENHVFIVNAMVEGTVVSSAMFIYSDNYIHYHLSGNDPKYFSYNSNNLILSKTCEWGKSNGKSILHLGGAFNGGLFNFKKQFTKEGIYAFYVGKKIRLNEVYNQLIELKGKSNNSYFPAYRG